MAKFKDVGNVIFPNTTLCKYFASEIVLFKKTQTPWCKENFSPQFYVEI